jgi:hypothetical protein
MYVQVPMWNQKSVTFSSVSLPMVQLDNDASSAADVTTGRYDCMLAANLAPLCMPAIEYDAEHHKHIGHAYNTQRRQSAPHIAANKK